MLLMKLIFRFGQEQSAQSSYNDHAPLMLLMNV